MNSVLQCVLHTEAIKDYFISQQYKLHLNKNNPLGTKGAALALVFGEMIESAWLSNESTLSPWGFKKIISQFAPQFIGYEQHDAHELLTFLLTGLHEDLNLVKIKPYIEKVDCDNLEDEQASIISWNWFLERNKSFFVDLMYGQLKSTLKCPKCFKTSITFDPFLTFSVNIPCSVKREFTVLVILSNNKIFKQDLDILSSTTIIKLKQMLIEKYKLNNIVLCVYNKLNIQGICDDYTEVSQYQGKGLFAYECQTFTTYIPVPIKLYQKSTLQPFTFTRVIFTQPLNTFSDIHEILKKSINGSYKINIINTAGNTGIFNKTRLPCDFCNNSNCNNCELLSNQTTMQEAQDMLKNSEGPFMLEVILDDNNPFIENCNELNETEPIIENIFFDSKVTLKNCLEHSMKPETLDLHNEWYCSGCKDNVGALKTLQMYRLPKVLIFQLVRFRNRGVFSQKINEFIVQAVSLRISAEVSGEI